MQIGVCLPHYGKGMEPEGMRTFAERAQALGYDSIWVTDHIVVPKDRDFVYRYDMLDALSMLTFLATVTSSIAIGTSIIVLPYRNPIVIAKQVATADVLSGGRVIAGVGVGGLQGEFELLSVDFHRRGALGNEALELMTSLWREPMGAVRTRSYDVRDAVFSPTPAQRPGPPVWVGGHSDAALRRAVKYGAAWHLNYWSADEVASASGRLATEAARIGRADVPEVTVRAMTDLKAEHQESERPWLGGSPERAVAELERINDMGVSHVVLQWGDLPFSEALEELERFGKEVLPYAKG